MLILNAICPKMEIIIHCQTLFHRVLGVTSSRVIEAVKLASHGLEFQVCSLERCSCEPLNWLTRRVQLATRRLRAYQMALAFKAELLIGPDE